MAGSTKVSNLPGATALTGNELFLAVQGGVSVAVSASQVSAAVLSRLADAEDEDEGDGLILVKQSFDYAAVRTQHQKNDDSLDLGGISGVVYGSMVPCDESIQAALYLLSYLGGARITARAREAIWLDDRLVIPSGIELDLPRSFTFKAIGRSTHGRNAKMFDRCNGTGLFTAMIVLAGDDVAIKGGTLDGNGMQNYYIDAGTGKKIYQGGDDIDPTWRLGMCGVRIGLDAYGQIDNRPKYRNARVENVLVRYCAWGGIALAAESQRLVSGQTYPSSDLFGYRDVRVVGNTIEFCGSNNLPVIGVEDFEISGNMLVSPVHTGIKLYRNLINGVVANNRVIYRDDRYVSWVDGQSADYYREDQFTSRSEAISIGHNTNTGIYRNVYVGGNVLDGGGKMFRGIALYAPVNGVVIGPNAVRGFVRPFTFGAVGRVEVSGGTYEAVNYTYTAKTPGTQVAGETVAPAQSSIATIEGAYARSVVTFSGVSFGGKCLNLVRMTDYSTWDALGLGCHTSFTGCTFDLSALEDHAGLTKAGIVQTSAPAAVSRTVYKGNTYIVAGGASTDSYEDVYGVNVNVHTSVITDLLWKRSLVLTSGVSAGVDGAPRLVYDDATGMVRLQGSVVGYTVGTSAGMSIVSSPLYTRFRNPDNTDYTVANSNGKRATLRVTSSGNIFISSADDAAQRVDLAGVSWSTRS